MPRNLFDRRQNSFTDNLFFGFGVPPDIETVSSECVITEINSELQHGDTVPRQEYVLWQIFAEVGEKTVWR